MLIYVLKETIKKQKRIQTSISHFTIDKFIQDGLIIPTTI
jgi:hypothetical protein